MKTFGSYWQWWWTSEPRSCFIATLQQKSPGNTLWSMADRHTDRQTFLFNIWKNQISGGEEWSQGLGVILPRNERNEPKINWRHKMFGQQKTILPITACCFNKPQFWSDIHILLTKNWNIFLTLGPLCDTFCFYPIVNLCTWHLEY